MPCQFNMIFREYLRIYCAKITPGGAATWPRGWLARPLSHGPTVAPLHLFLHPHTSSSSHKHEYPAQGRVLAHLAAIFDLLAQSSIRKTVFGDFSSVCDSSNGPISFCSSALYIANFCCCGDLVLELACEIYMVQIRFDA